MKLEYYDHGRMNWELTKSKPSEIGFVQVGKWDESMAGTMSCGEFHIAIHRFDGENHLAVELQVFDDAAGALAAFIGCGAWASLIARSHSKTLRSVSDVCELLSDFGMVDRSRR